MSPILRNRIAALAVLAMGIAVAGDAWQERRWQDRLERHGTLTNGVFQGVERNRHGCFVSARIAPDGRAPQEPKIKASRAYCDTVEAGARPATVEVRYLPADPGRAGIPGASPVSTGHAALAALWIAAAGLWTFVTFRRQE